MFMLARIGKNLAQIVQLRYTRMEMFHGFFALRFSDYFVVLLSFFFAAIVRILKQQQKGTQKNTMHTHMP